MNLIVDRKAFKEYLEIVGKALGKNDSEPICTHYLFRVGASECEVLAGGKGGQCGYLKIEGLPPTNVPDGKVVEFTADGERLVGFLGDVPDGNINISYDEAAKKVNVKPDAIKANFNLISLAPKDYPDFETDFKTAKAAGKKGTLSVAVLSDAVGFTKQFIGTNLTNPGLSLCRLKVDGTVNTGDGKTIAIYKSSTFGGEFKLRQTMMDGVMAFVSKSEGDLALYEGGNYYFLENAKGYYYGFNKVSYDIPAAGMPDLFDAGVGDTIFEVDRDRLAGAIRRLKWSVDKDVSRMGFKLTGTGLDTVLTVSAKDTNGTISEEEVGGVARTKGSDDLTFHLNYGNVLKGIEHMTNLSIHFCINRQGVPYAKMLEAVKFDSADANSADVVRILFLALIRSDR